MKAYMCCCRYCGTAIRYKDRYVCNCTGVELTEDHIDDYAGECPEFRGVETPLQEREIENDY